MADGPDASYTHAWAGGPSGTIPSDPSSGPSSFSETPLGLILYKLKSSMYPICIEKSADVSMRDTACFIRTGLLWTAKAAGVVFSYTGWC